MKKQIKYFAAFLAIACLTPMAQSCKENSEPKQQETDEALIFSATTVNKNSNTVTASSRGKNTTVSANLTLIVNGVEVGTTTETRRGNELAVIGGKEVTVTFTPSCAEETAADFTMPDGTHHMATVAEPSFTWTAPETITEGMTITGESHYETATQIITSRGVITLYSAYVIR